MAEIFSSRQGEGPYLGVPQFFVRFSVCPLRCRWCDTPGALTASPVCCVWRADGSRSFWQNPLTVAQVAEEMDRQGGNGSRPHSVSFTGGEPLMQPAFLKALAQEARRRDLLVFLETAGIHDDALASVIGDVDIVSMDIKLPSSTRERRHWDAHERFLAVARRAQVCVKVVLTSDTLDQEVERAVNLVASQDSSIPLTLQPVTPQGGCQPPSEDQIAAWRRLASERLQNVLRLPQVHRLVGWR